VNSAEQVSLESVRQRAMEVRALYEAIERRMNGQVWTLQELMLGFSNDVGTVGRLVLAHDGTWEIDGDVDAQLAHKLSESLWWVIVIAERLGIDISAAFGDTMDRIEQGLAPSAGGPTTSADRPPAP
jgi:NTP pyrophosphatase (non-canonical NTP hydrolase)